MCSPNHSYTFDQTTPNIFSCSFIICMFNNVVADIAKRLTLVADVPSSIFLHESQKYAAAALT